MCSPGRGTHITRDICLPEKGTHTSSDMCGMVREHISIRICVSQVVISVPRVGEHISLGISLLCHSDMCSPVLSEMCFPYKRNSDNYVFSYLGSRYHVSRVKEHISPRMCVSQVGEHSSLVESLPLPKKQNIPGDVCSPTWETHIALILVVGEHISLVICISREG